VVSSGPESPAASGACPPPPVALTRTARGWSVQSPAGAEPAADLVEGLSLADLVAEEFGALLEPDRTARRSARGHAGPDGGPVDPLQARVAELERTVAQLEHALAARVSTERAIGVLAERHGTSARDAFDAMRRDARSQGRPVAELAREVLDGIVDRAPADDAGSGRSGRSLPAPGLRPEVVVAAVAAPAPRIPSAPPAVAAADGVS
jgi:hypothetical protein